MAPFETSVQNAALVGRFQREVRIGHFEEVRGPRYARFLEYTGEGLTRLRVALEKSSLPEEVREELRTNVTAMQSEIRKAIESYNPRVATDTASRIHRHLSQLHAGLLAQQFLGSRSELLYAFEETTSELEGFLYRGDIREFRNA